MSAVISTIKIYNYRKKLLQYVLNVAYCIFATLT